MSSLESSISPPRERQDVGESVIPVADHIRRNEDGSIHVLHVDDDPDLLDLTASFLEQVDDGISVNTENRARDALERYQRNEDEIECIVSDYQMPEMDGLDFLQEVRNEYPDVPFILFTGKGSEEVASDAIAGGVTEYMQKGAGTDKYQVLANRIRNAVEQYRAERAYQTTLTWYQRLCEQSVAGTYLIHDESFVYVNEKLANVFGYEQDALIGTDPLSLVSDRDRELVAENLRARVEGEEDAIRYQFMGVRKDGTSVEIEVHGSAIEFGGEPAILGVIAESAS